MRASLRASWFMAVLIAMLLVMAVVPAAQAAPEAAPAAASCGYWYAVQPGDSWSRVSARTGVSVAALQAANPGLVRPPRYWLYVGDSLWIPCGAPPPPPPSCGYWYRVQPGDSWYAIARRTGIPVATLQAANPSKVRPPSYVIYAGESIWIPCGSVSPPVPPPGPPPPGPPPSTCVSYYTVQRGDSWYRISGITGVPVNMLYAANPTKVRPPSYVLYVGETLCIPDP